MVTRTHSKHVIYAFWAQGVDPLGNHSVNIRSIDIYGASLRWLAHGPQVTDPGTWGRVVALQRGMLKPKSSSDWTSARGQPTQTFSSSQSSGVKAEMMILTFTGQVL